jgi:hypothetical protein
VRAILPQQLEHPPVTRPPLDRAEQRVVIDLVKTHASMSALTSHS